MLCAPAAAPSQFRPQRPEIIPVVRRPVDIRGGARRALERLRGAWQPLALASTSAALAWLFAHRVLGHAQPFFAPIAAAISLSTSRIQRSRRIVQMVGGVLLGIGVAELLSAVLGTSTGALLLIVFVTLTGAVLSGVGFVGQGMMFANQAAASAILVVTLHRHGTGSERAVDAIVGGAVALILGVLLFPAEPLSLLDDAERRVLRTLADALRHCVRRGDEPPDESWMLAVGDEIHQGLAALNLARATARANVRVAPRRWRLRGLVDAETARVAHLHLLANAVLGLIRAVSYEPRPLPQELRHHLTALTDAVEQLATSARPRPDAVLDQARATAEQLMHYAEQEPHSTAAAVLRATARDLSRVLTRV